MHQLDSPVTVHRSRDLIDAERIVARLQQVGIRANCIQSGMTQVFGAIDQSFEVQIGRGDLHRAQEVLEEIRSPDSLGGEDEKGRGAASTLDEAAPSGTFRRWFHDKPYALPLTLFVAGLVLIVLGLLGVPLGAIPGVGRVLRSSGGGDGGGDVALGIVLCLIFGPATVIQLRKTWRKEP